MSLSSHKDAELFNQAVVNFVSKLRYQESLAVFSRILIKFRTQIRKAADHTVIVSSTEPYDAFKRGFEIARVTKDKEVLSVCFESHEFMLFWRPGSAGVIDKILSKSRNEYEEAKNLAVMQEVHNS